MFDRIRQAVLCAIFAVMGLVVICGMAVNAAAQNFHLDPMSPARGAGIREVAYDLFMNEFGISIDYYQDGTPRTSRSFDIGPLPAQ